MPAHSEDEPAGAVSGLPVPRFVSLKADKVNLRAGPTREHDVTWVFTRAGLPVEITAESENWRRIRDSEGTEGWVYHSLLSSRRTVLVAPWSKKDETFSLHESGDRDAPVTAQLQPGVLGAVKSCDKKWCRIFGENFDGYIEQERLWGVYPNESIE
jgi:SH3-like domain-containing protein